MFGLNEEKQVSESVSYYA